MLELVERVKGPVLAQPRCILYPRTTTPSLARGLAARQVPRHPLYHPVVQFQEGPPAAPAPEVVDPAPQVGVHRPADAAPLLAREARASHPLPEGFPKPLTCPLARPTQHPPHLPLLPLKEDPPVMEPEKVKAFSDIFHHLRLLRMKSQPQVRQCFPRPDEGALGVLARTALNQKVVRVADQPPEEGFLAFVPLVEGVEIDVGEQGREDPSLRRTRLGVVVDASSRYPAFSQR